MKHGLVKQEMKREQERWMEDGGDGNHAELFYTPGKTVAFTVRKREGYESSGQRSDTL